MVEKIYSYNRSIGIGVGAFITAKRLEIDFEEIPVFGYPMALPPISPVVDPFERSLMESWDRRLLERLPDPEIELPDQLMDVDGILFFGEDKRTRKIFEAAKGRIRCLNPDLSGCVKVIEKTRNLAILGNPNVPEYGNPISCLLLNVPYSKWRREGETNHRTSARDLLNLLTD